jgi:flavin-dependent dehydrogenase
VTARRRPPVPGDAVEVAIVGGGLAGAALAARLAAAGHAVAAFEQSPAWRWRAGGVFASPAAVAALRRTGLDERTLGDIARPIPAMRVETPRGTSFRLTYGVEDGGEPAVGFDRAALDPALVTLARDAGADVRLGTAVTAVDPDSGELAWRDGAGRTGTLRAAVVVGADGSRSMVARAAGVARSVRLGRRIGLTYHLPDAEPGEARDARLRVFHDGYVGIAPVANGRINIGIVLGASWREALARNGADAVTRTIVGATPATPDDPARWRQSRRCDAIAGAWPLGHRVTRSAGPSWLLVGDAAGFLDPFTGEGIHRALVSAELAARAIHARLSGEAGALDAYARAMQRRFLAKDAVSWLVQGFLARPALFDYAARRLAARPAVRATMGRVMGDLVPAGRALDPRYLAALLAP